MLDCLLGVVCRSQFLSVIVTIAAWLQSQLSDGNLGRCLPGQDCRANPLDCLSSSQQADQTAWPFVPGL